MASNYDAARQEFVDRINAGVSLGVPFIQKRVNLGAKAITEDARSNGIITLFVPAGGTGGVEELSTKDGINNNALNRTQDEADGKGSASYYKVECYARNAWELISYTALEEMFKIGKLRENVIQPRINHLCQDIERDVVTRNTFRAGGAVVADDSAIGFIAMDKAMAMLQSIKSTGSWTGYISPMMKSKLGTSAALKNGGFDVPDEVLRSIYGKQSIGVFAGADWINEPFMPKFVQGESLAKEDAGVAVSVEVSEQGADTIILTGVAGSSVKKGTPFTIEGVYDVTTAGLKAEWLKVFVAQADAAVSGGSASVKVLPIYFNDDTKGYANNVFVDGSKISATAVVKGLCSANTAYDVALIKEDESFNWTPFTLPDVDGCTNTTSATEDISVQLVSGGTLLTRKNQMRLDSPYFGDIVDPRACRLVYVKA